MSINPGQNLDQIRNVGGQGGVPTLPPMVSMGIPVMPDRHDDKFKLGTFHHLAHHSAISGAGIGIVIAVILSVLLFCIFKKRKLIKYYLATPKKSPIALKTVAETVPPPGSDQPEVETTM